MTMTLPTESKCQQTLNRITGKPVREHLEQVLWARLEELIERK